MIKLRNLKVLMILISVLALVFAFNCCYAVDLNLSTEFNVKSFI